MDRQSQLSNEVILKSLLENYECIYDVDISNSNYNCYYESEEYSGLDLAKSGSNFFSAMAKNVKMTIYKEDQDYLLKALTRDNLLSSLKHEKYFSLVYRLNINDKCVYHQIRATIEMIGDTPHILIGIKNIDTAVRLDNAHKEERDVMVLKEKNHLEAILSSASGYLEVNLTKNLIESLSPNLEQTYHDHGQYSLNYNEFQNWWHDNIVVDKKEKFEAISNRDFLIESFKKGDSRASLTYTSKMTNGELQPCRKVFFLYQDENTKDICAFAVLYDLTESQKQELELEKLQNELQKSRIRNFTSQMQPHFLYNSLGSIQEIILDNPQYAYDLLGDFTVHLRSCIRAMASDDPIPFSQELDNIKAYLNIEKMRFGSKLEIDINTKVVDFMIIPLTIQPLVENAIRHGIYQKGVDGGKISIMTYDDEGSIYIIVADDGVGFEKTKAFDSNESTGLKNIMFRLDKMMNASVQIDSTIGKGTTVLVRVPKEGKDADNRSR